MKPSDAWQIIAGELKDLYQIRLILGMRICSENELAAEVECRRVIKEQEEKQCLLEERSGNFEKPEK